MPEEVPQRGHVRAGIDLQRRVGVAQVVERNIGRQPVERAERAEEPLRPVRSHPPVRSRLLADGAGLPERELEEPVTCIPFMVRCSFSLTGPQA